MNVFSRSFLIFPDLISNFACRKSNLFVKMQKPLILLFLLPLLLCIGCSEQQPHYTIGVSQCSADIWREKQNSELRMGAYLRNDVDLLFAAAYDSDERQVQQIDSLLRIGIDLLIVAPNQVQTISPAIDRAYDSGIPVIVFERKTNSEKYTAFISADNYEMGKVMGEYVAHRLNFQGRVLEVMGLNGSSPAIDRHRGFTDALCQYPGIEIVDTLQGDWTEQSAYLATQLWLEQQPAAVDFVFGQNDRMAMGARRAYIEKGERASGKNPKLPYFCGIDGLPGEGGGIQLVRDSILDATYIYPTHGDRLLDLAVSILEGKPYEKEVRLMSALVTQENARVILMQAEETLRQTDYLDRLHERTDHYLRQLDTQRIISGMFFGVIALLIITLVLLYRYHLRKIAMQKERVVNTLWNMKPEDVPNLPETATQPVESEQELTDEADENEPAAISFFITRFKEVVESRLENSDVSVEDLAADMNLSRVQLYRKVKSITGSSPVELLRSARLKRAYQLLITTDMSVSEVAYAVGFTAPSYFTKCFKEEYGMVPGEARG